ncbi:ShlB/FhaC/HecB family hemolysin secretion/activation protein [Winogradskyella maritima]|uniref:ShlB/FhaC/HecB family hemolysin secretion/activation protein n=1 Tax=Winogradskyella maritima TaxID=1517766 RepID=A0ABV8AJ98_9FLAO|nr:ShlB/FhaC/HecB family hemolysin secretion/activation protein [Winogradskyella maritima]
MKPTIPILTLLIMLFVSAFAKAQQELPNKKISHTFYAIGNTAEGTTAQLQEVLDGLQKTTKNASKESTLLFLGNAVNSKDDNTLQLQTKLANSFKGTSFFIPGDAEWTDGFENLRNIEKTIDKAVGKNTFQPERGCPMERVKINDEVDMIIVDSQWAIMNWDAYPTINEHCDIKTKEEFYVELESTIKKSEGKTVILAMHHPVESLGRAGSQFSFGVNPQDVSNVHYKELSERVVTIARQIKNVVLLSAHDHSLQYFDIKGIPNIISGSGSATAKVGSVKGGFSSSQLGFSKITQFKDGAVWVSFYDASNGFSTAVFSKEVRPRYEMVAMQDYKEYESPQYVNKSIYTEEELERSGFYKALWGEHYRDDYAKEIKIKTALLDTLYGGLKPLRKGGGHQTNSIRLVDKDGRQYAMRSAKKSALRFIQYFLFKTEYLEAEVEETYFVQLLQDYWTTANPFGALTIGDLADAVGILHPNPALYYIPKQNALGNYNDDYGDNIYFIEERLSDGQEDVASLGAGDKIINTLELFEELRNKDEVTIDERLYIRTRIFDNLIGDWDRHADQWKWTETEDENGKMHYRPIPRDRDQVYSDFDGFILGALTTLTPPLRFMQRYDEDYNHVKWYNDAGDDVDLAVLKNHKREDWVEEAQFIKANITEDVIEKAFANLPPEIDQEKVARVKKALKGRLANIESNANNMFEYLSRCILVTGTDKKDLFIITRMPDGKTKIVGERQTKEEMGEVFWDVTYDRKDTKEIWIYGLADDDTFRIEGEGNKTIHLKIIGGNGNDTYEALNRKNVKVYDHKKEENTFKAPVAKMLSDNYDLNTYYFKKHRRDLSNTTPLLGFDPDDGLGIGARFNYQKNSLVRNPFTDEHHLGLTYFYETSSVNVSYSGEFAYIFNKVNLGIEAGYSSPSYTDNFFGFGNETENFEDDLGRDFNRVRTQRLSFAPSLIFRGYQGSEIKLGVRYDNYEIENTANRFIAQADINPENFEGQNFGSIEASYEYDNLKDAVVSKAGLGFKLTAGFTSNLENSNNFGYLIPEARIATKLDNRGNFILASKVKGHINLGNEFEFYQGATIGGNDGLRGFRNERFTGKQSFYHSTDFRVALGRLRNGIIPITVGAYAGFDYGRVWLQNEDSEEWHTSPGAGMYFKMGGFAALNFAYFDSDEGGRITFGLSLPF